jgi:hypothetical protein
VQPWGKDKGRQASVLSEHATSAEAFAAIDRMTQRSAPLGTRIEVLELLVADADGNIVARPGVQ